MPETVFQKSAAKVAIGFFLKLRFLKARLLVAWLKCLVGNKKPFGKICILNLRNKRKRIFARAIIRKWRWKKITKETGKNIIKSTCRWNNRTKFREWITRGEFVHFRSTIDPSRNRSRSIQFLIFNFIKKVFLFQLT